MAIFKPITLSKKELGLDLVKISSVAVRNEADKAKMFYERTTRSWRTKPVFTVTVYDKGTRAVIRTTDKIYNYVDKGTRAHRIQPKAPGYPLRFMRGFVPKTRFRFVGSFEGGKHPPIVTPMSVQHPGAEAREFTEEIQETIDLDFYRQLEQALDLMLR